MSACHVEIGECSCVCVCTCVHVHVGGSMSACHVEIGECSCVHQHYFLLELGLATRSYPSETMPKAKQKAD